MDFTKSTIGNKKNIGSLNSSERNFSYDSKNILTESLKLKNGRFSLKYEEKKAGEKSI